MAEHDTIHHDAPENWERYADMLKEHGRAEVPAGLEQRLSREWDGRMARRNRGARLRNGVLITGALVTVFLAMFRLGSENAPTPAVQPEPVAPSAVLEQPDIFANPDIPPVWIDTNLPAFESMPFPEPGEIGIMDASRDPFFMYGDTVNPNERPVTGD